MINPSDYYFTSSDMYHGLETLWDRMDVRSIVGLIILGEMSVILSIYFGISLESIFFLGFMFFMFFWKIDSRVSIGIALICLVFIPFFEILSRYFNVYFAQVWAEKVAVWAYYF